MANERPTSTEIAAATEASTRRLVAECILSQGVLRRGKRTYVAKSVP